MASNTDFGHGKSGNGPAPSYPYAPATPAFPKPAPPSQAPAKPGPNTFKY
jgi:hypothetical protein